VRWQQLMATGGRNCAKPSRPQRFASRVRCFLAVVRFATLLTAVAAGLLELVICLRYCSNPRLIGCQNGGSPYAEGIESGRKVKGVCGAAATAAGVAVMLLILRMSMQDVPERAQRGILCASLDPLRVPPNLFGPQHTHLP